MADDRHIAEKFGRGVVARARDGALTKLEWALSGSAVGGLRDLEGELRRLTPEQKHLVRLSVRVSVDQAIAELLGYLEEAELDGLSLTMNGVDVARASDGLSFALHGEDGWFAKYSAFGDIDELPAAPPSP